MWDGSKNMKGKIMVLEGNTTSFPLQNRIGGNYSFWTSKG